MRQQDGQPVGRRRDVHPKAGQQPQTSAVPSANPPGYVLLQFYQISSLYSDCPITASTKQRIQQHNTLNMPTHTAVHGSVDDWFDAFYAVSDDGFAHDDYVTFYAANAKLIMGDKTAIGHDGSFSLTLLLLFR